MAFLYTVVKMSDERPKFCEVDKFLLNVQGSGVPSPVAPAEKKHTSSNESPKPSMPIMNNYEAQANNENGVDGKSCLLIEMPLISYQMPDLTQPANDGNSSGPPLLTPKLMSLEVKSNTIPTVEPAKSNKN